jgi:hypothetical protein
MRWLVLSSLLGVCGVAHAEHGCQDGFIPVNQGSGQTCVADYNLPYWKNQGNAAQAQMGPRWKTTWGAFATDGPSAALGASVGMPNKRKAEKTALAQCREKGGKNCEVDVAFYNQCAVLVTGDSVYNTSHAATVEEASRLGIAECEKEDVNCRVYYSDCSLPVRID